METEIGRLECLDKITKSVGVIINNREREKSKEAHRAWRGSSKCELFIISCLKI